MPALLENPTFKLYAICSAAIAVHMLLLAFWTAARRAKAKRFLNSEDMTLDKEAKIVEVEDAAVQRVKRVHQNAIESAVPFFVLGLLYVLTGASVLGAQVFFFTFIAARVLHSIFYLAAKQPFRTMSFAIGALALIGMAVQVIRASV